MKDLVDKAVIDAAENELNTKKIKQDYEKINEILFDFRRQRMSVVVQNQTDEHLLVTRGAAEEMPEASSFVEVSGQRLPLTKKQEDKVLANINDMSNDGLRVILLGHKKNPVPVDEFSIEDESELTIVGFLAFLDPPKETTGEALYHLEEDGITAKILTGDNAAVTRAVGKQVGLDISKIYSGNELEGKTDAGLNKTVEESDIFVKLSPELKTKIIEILKKDGHTVGHMGDGINDAPAVKAADVSISVDTAVDIVKESADIILLHKDLRILENGVRIGRKIFGNTMKYTKITLSSNLGNILSILIASSFLPFLSMLPPQLLIPDLLYGASRLVVPLDKMDAEYLSQPRAWSTKKLPKLMPYFGPISSAFDTITFALLYFVVYPSVAEGSFTSLNMAGQAVFIAVFHTGWLIESLWTQEMAIHALRDQCLPLIKQRAAAPVMPATFGAAVIGSCLPYLRIVISLRFGPIPGTFIEMVFALLVFYILLTTLAKRLYLRKEKLLI